MNLPRARKPSQFASPSQELLKQDAACDPFNESMGSQIDGSIEPQMFNQAELLQGSLENLELNPPPELLDAISWDKPSEQSRGSVLKFAPTFPPLISEIQ